MAFEITIPRLGWSMEEGVFVGWLKNDGDVVREGEPIFTLESDKAAQEVEAMESGTLRIAADAPNAGTTVPVGTRLGWLVAEGEATPTSAATAPVMTVQAIAAAPGPNLAHEQNPAESAPPASARGSAISPRAARTAAALGIDVRAITGTGRGGRIRERDVLAAPGPDAARVPTPVLHKTEPDRPGREIPLSNMRRTIARRMSAGVHEAAPVTLTTRVDATELVRARTRLKSAAVLGAALPSYHDFLIKAVAVALLQHPMLRAQWREETLFIPDAIDIALAIETDAGLVAPVLRNVPALTLAELAEQSRALIDAARAGQLTPAYLNGGVFTISSLGSLGIDAFTPVLNLPQCAILGIGRIVREPVAEREQIVLRDLLTLSLTFDHRVIDGAPAARFLETLRDLIAHAASAFPSPPIP